MQNKKAVPDFPKNISICFSEGFCNLKCPKCQVYGKSRKNNKIIKGTMGLDKACKLLDELKDSNSVLAGGGHTEPFIQKDFWSYLKEIKYRDIRVNINTNGLLLTAECAKKLVDLKIDGVFISIDATTEKTLEEVRGTNELKKINNTTFSVLKARGNKLHPRVGVSFVVEKANAHEKEDFIKFWIQHADVVRIAELFSKGNKTISNAFPKKRKPCSMLYDFMLIHYNGDVPICCWDGYGETNLGNVFEKGIQGVWLGEGYQKMRYYHETGQFHKIPFCKDCHDWIRYDFTTEEVVDNVLIRRSPLLVYYNRIDRLNTWKFGDGKTIKLEVQNNEYISRKYR